jgi:hypothetical protein
LSVAERAITLRRMDIRRGGLRSINAGCKVQFFIAYDREQEAHRRQSFGQRLSSCFGVNPGTLPGFGPSPSRLPPQPFVEESLVTHFRCRHLLKFHRLRNRQNTPHHFESHPREN